MAIRFLQTLSADGQSNTFAVPGVKFTVGAFGSFGGGTVKLQVLADGTNWRDVTDASFTAAGQKTINFGSVADAHGYVARFDLSGSTSPDIDLEVY